MIRRCATVAAGLVLAATVSGCAGAPLPSAAPPTSSAVVSSVVKIAAHQRDWRPTRVTISAIGVDAPISPMGLQPDGSVEVPPITRPDLVGWYAGSPEAGSPGPTVLLGHHSVRGIPGVFEHLGELTVGAEISVTRADGTTIRYAVTRLATYPKSRFPTDEVYGDRPGPELRIITCARSGTDPTRFDANTVVDAVQRP